jgi:hypothetical protein
MQWHTTYEVQELARLHQEDMLRDAENHRRAKEARDQRRQQKLAAESEGRSSRLTRALTRALHPAK